MQTFKYHDKMSICIIMFARWQVCAESTTLVNMLHVLIKTLMYEHYNGFTYLNLCRSFLKLNII